MSKQTTDNQAGADDAAKKAAAEEAARKAAEANDGEDDDQDPDDGDLGDLSPKQKAYIEKLRKENAKTRVQAKESKKQLNELNDRFGKLETGLKSLFGGDENLTPEEKLKKLDEEKNQLAAEREALALSSAMREAAIEHGVGKDAFEYFEFLVQKKASALKDGEELSEDDIAAIAKQAKGKSAPKTTSVSGAGSDGQEPPPEEDDGELSLEEFQAMGIVSRSKLYQTDPALYEKMVNAEKLAKKKKKI